MTTKNDKASQPAPRYDDVHADSVAWLDELATEEATDRGTERLVEIDPTEVERVRTGPVTAEEALEIAHRFVNGHFHNGKEGPRISIPADPMRDDDLRLVAFIEQSAAEIERLREDLDQRARAGAGVAFDLKELQDERDELRTKLDTAERESCAAIQKLIAERDAAVAERDDLKRRVRLVETLRDDARTNAALLMTCTRDEGAPDVAAAHDSYRDRLDAILTGAKS